MKFNYHNKRIRQTFDSFYKEETFELPKRLGEKNYALPFKVLKNYYLVRIFGIN